MSQIVTATEAPQHPTVAELEEAITHLSATCQRYGPYALKYSEWHEEINHLLDDRDGTLSDMARECLQRKMSRDGFIIPKPGETGLLTPPDEIL